MKNFAFILSTILTGHIYKWIFPSVITILFLFFANSNRSDLIRLILWVLLCVAYLSLPLNFEHPKKATYSFFLQRNLVNKTVILIQGLVLSALVFVLTQLSISIYFSKFDFFGPAVSILNSALYFGTLLLEYWLLPDKVQEE